MRCLEFLSTQKNDPFYIKDVNNFIFLTNFWFHHLNYNEKLHRRKEEKSLIF